MTQHLHLAVLVLVLSGCHPRTTGPVGPAPAAPEARAAAITPSPEATAEADVPAALAPNGRVIGVQKADDGHGGTLLIIKLESVDGVEAGWRGKLLDAGDRPVPWGDLVIETTHSDTVLARTGLGRDRVVASSRRVHVAAPVATADAAADAAADATP